MPVLAPTVARPFGLTRATPLAPTDVEIPATLTVCPIRQITVTENGIPFILAPSMETTIQTVVKTKEDNQVWDDEEGTDTDPQR